MKKFLAVVAAICLCVSFMSCSKEREEEMSTNPDVKQDIENKNKEAKKTEKEAVPAVTVPETTEKNDTDIKEESEKNNENSTDKEENSSSEQNQDSSQKKEDTAQEIKVPSPEEFFPTVAKEFVFEDGNTKTVLKVQKDGSFTGIQTKTDTSSTGSNYSNGTKTECHFTGKFTMALPLDEYTYISVMDGYKVNNPSDEETIKDNTKYIYTENSDIASMKEVVFYMPGAPTKTISDDFLKHMPDSENLGEKLPENLYGIFDMNNKMAFHSNK